MVYRAAFKIRQFQLPTLQTKSYNWNVYYKYIDFANTHTYVLTVKNTTKNIYSMDQICVIILHRWYYIISYENVKQFRYIIVVK